VLFAANYATFTCVRAEQLVMQDIIIASGLFGSCPTIDSDSGKEGIDCSKSGLILNLIG